MSESAFKRVEQLLTSRNIAFGVSRHKPVYTSEEAAAVRGVSLSSGAKALICDEKLSENTTINFNAGDHTISVSMRYVDYLEAEQPEVGSFAE